MSLLQGLVDLATQIIAALGYPGVFLLMAMESMVLPVPSEAVMPFAGFLVSTGEFHSVWLVTLVATLGSVAGSSLSYWMGAKWGETFVVRYGKWLLITPHDWELTKRFFRSTSGWSIFLARFVPAVRHLVSLPAGATRMRWRPFLLGTTLGAFLWNGFLAYLGARLGENWDEIGRRLEPFDLVIVGLLLAGALAFLALHLRRLRSPARPPTGPT